MENENLNNNNEQLSPFKIEKIEEVTMPHVNIENGKLVIDGVLQEKYDHVSDVKHKDSGLVYINAYEGGDKDEHWAGRIIDTKNPETELVNVRVDRNTKDVFVNGHRWDILKNKQFYFGGYLVETDPEGKNIVFQASSESGGWHRQYVIVNNVQWKTEFEDGISKASSKGGFVYAFGGYNEKNKFAIDDKEWIYNRHKEEVTGRLDEIVNVEIGNNDTVVAMIYSPRSNDGYRGYISVGDTTGEKYVWDNTLALSDRRSNKIAIDDAGEHIAVFGQIERDGKTSLIIDDIPYELQGNPETVEYMKFEDGGLVVQYDTATGKKISEKIVLQENSKEIQSQREKKDMEEKAFTELRRLLAQENMSPVEMISRLKEVEEFKGKLLSETGKVNHLSETVNVLMQENSQLKLENTQIKEDDNIAIANLENEQKKTQRALQEVRQTLSGAGKVTMGSSFKLSPQEMDTILVTIDSVLKKTSN